MANIDIVELVQQTNGEFEEKYAIRHLDIVTTLPNEVILIEPTADAVARTGKSVQQRL